MDRDWSFGLMMLLLTVVGVVSLLTVVNAGAYLLGAGETVEVHVERIRTEPMPAGDADGRPAVVDARIGVGWYVDDEGRRHDIELTGFAGEPGDVVETRLPLLPEWLAFPVHRTSQAILALLLGLIGLGLPIVVYLVADS